MTDDVDPFVTYPGLKALGIPYGREYINKMIRQGKFPASYQLSRQTIAWRLSELRQWMDSRPVAVKAPWPADASDPAAAK